MAANAGLEWRVLGAGALGALPSPWQPTRRCRIRPVHAGANMKQRCLLATMTNEPFQPARLYYAIADRKSVVEKLRALLESFKASYRAE